MGNKGTVYRAGLRVRPYRTESPLAVTDDDPTPVSDVVVVELGFRATSMAREPDSVIITETTRRIPAGCGDQRTRARAADSWSWMTGRTEGCRFPGGTLQPYAGRWTSETRNSRRESRARES